MIIYSENIYTPEGVRKGYIEIEGKIIRNICTDENELKNKSDQTKDYTDFYIIPGFIDNHVHGWGTGSFWKEGTEEAMYNMKKRSCQNRSYFFFRNNRRRFIGKNNRHIEKGKKSH